MIRDFRAWLPDQPEPIDNFPFRSASPESAAKSFILAHHDLASQERALERIPTVMDLKKRPQLVLVRERDSLRRDPHRIKVTAEIEIAVWGYPADVDDDPKEAP